MVKARKATDDKIIEDRDGASGVADISSRFTLIASNFLIVSAYEAGGCEDDNIVVSTMRSK